MVGYILVQNTAFLYSAYKNSKTLIILRLILKLWRLAHQIYEVYLHEILIILYILKIETLLELKLSSKTTQQTMEGIAWGISSTYSSLYLN